MEWAMLYLFVALKVPLIALFWLIWWAVRQEPKLEDSPEGGQRVWSRPHPPPKLPRPTRRGPHSGDAVPLPPPRVRPVDARARQYER